MEHTLQKASIKRVRARRKNNCILKGVWRERAWVISSDFRLTHNRLKEMPVKVLGSFVSWLLNTAIMKK